MREKCGSLVEQRIIVGCVGGGRENEVKIASPRGGGRNEI